MSTATSNSPSFEASSEFTLHHFREFEVASFAKLSPTSHFEVSTVESCGIARRTFKEIHPERAETETKTGLERVLKRASSFRARLGARSRGRNMLLVGSTVSVKKTRD